LYRTVIYLDFVVTRFLMKLIRTVNHEVKKRLKKIETMYNVNTITDDNKTGSWTRYMGLSSFKF